MKRNALRSKLKHRLRESKTSGPVLLTIIVGMITGLGAVGFRLLVKLGRDAFLGTNGTGHPGLPDWYVVVIPVVGLIIVSFIVRTWAPEARGHGVPEVMYAIRKGGGRIRPRVAWIKAVASALTIGSGGSVGREGPMVQIGASLGSSLGQLLDLDEEDLKLYVACGSAAAIGSTFNAPVAGVLFAMEVILGTFTGRAFGLVVVSSVSATAVSQALLGSEPAFSLHRVFALVSPFELLVYMGLGIFAGGISWLFVKMLHWIEDLFEAWPVPWWIQAGAAGLSVGIIGYIGIHFLGGPFLFGVGYDGIEKALRLGTSAGGMTALTLGALLVLKILSTSTSLAGGGSGGVFAPAMFMGAMAGGMFGLAADHIAPNLTAAPGAYVLVGMGAVFAGSARAPLTAVLILFEMTDDYEIILPLMLSVVLSYLIAARLTRDSLYNVKLRRMGGLLPQVNPSVLDVILVADAMSPPPAGISPDTPVKELPSKLSDGQALPVMADGELAGVITSTDVGRALLRPEENGADKTAASIMTSDVVTCIPSESLADVLHRLDSMQIHHLLVVDENDPHKLLGVLRRDEILWAYSEMAHEHARLIRKSEMQLPDDRQDWVQLALDVDASNEPLCFHRVRDVPVPEHCLIVLVRRAGHLIVPRGRTVIEPGDSLVVLTTRDHEGELRRWISSQTSKAAS